MGLWLLGRRLSSLNTVGVGVHLGVHSEAVRQRDPDEVGHDLPQRGVTRRPPEVEWVPDRGEVT